MANVVSLVKCTAKEFYTAGPNPSCRTVTVTNPATNPLFSKITVQVIWSDGTQSSVVLANGESHTWTCAMRSITAHETVSDSSQVQWTVDA